MAQCHLIYCFFILLCVLQLPIFITLLSLGHHISCAVLRPRSDLWVSSNNNGNNSNNNDNDNNDTSNYSDTVQSAMVVFDEERLYLGSSLSCMFGLAAIFGVMYMVLTNIDERAEFLNQEDAAAQVTDECNAHLAVQIQRVCFWVFVWFHGFILLALALFKEHGGVVEHISFLNVHRCIGLFGLCRTAPWEKNTFAQICVSGVYIRWFVWCIMDSYEFASSLWGLFLPQILILDLVLVWGHWWDRSATMLVALNCRLFFVACSGGILLITVLVLCLSSSSSIPASSL